MKSRLLLITLLCCTPVWAKVIHADYRSWGIYDANMPPSQLPLHRFTHLSYGEATPTADGKLLHPDPTADFQYIDINLGPEVTKAGNLAALPWLAQRHPQLTLLLQVGGYDANSNWQKALANHREVLLASIVQQLEEYDWHGVELEWHYPQTQQDQQNYLWLVGQLKSLGYDVIVSLPAVAITKDLWDLSDFHSLVDYYTINPYLAYGAWNQQSFMQWPIKSPVGEQLTVEKTIATYQQSGVPLDKIVLMLSPAAQGWANTTSPYSSNTGMLTGPYDSEQATGLFPRPKLVELLNNNWKVTFDDANVGAYASDGNHLITFESADSIKQKVRWVLGNDLAGIGISEIHHDSLNGNWSVSELVFSSIASPWQKFYAWWQQNLLGLLSFLAGSAFLAGLVASIIMWRRMRQQQQLDRQQQVQLDELTQHLRRLQIAALLGLRYWQALNNARLIGQADSYSQAAKFSSNILQHTPAKPLEREGTEFELVAWLQFWQPDLQGERWVTSDQQALAQLIDIWWQSVKQPSLALRQNGIALTGQNVLHLDQFAQMERLKQIGKQQLWRISWQDEALQITLTEQADKTDWQPLYKSLETAQPGKPWADAITAFLTDISEPATGQNITLKHKILGGHDIELVDQTLPSEAATQFDAMVSQLQVLGAQLNRITQSPQLLEDLHKISANYADISHIQSDRGYCQIHFADQQPSITTTLRLNAIKQWFHDDQWLAIHRSYLVNPDKCRAILNPSKNRHVVALENGLELPIGRNQLSTVQQHLATRNHSTDQ